MKERIQSGIIEDTIPQYHVGIWMSNEYGIRPSFAKMKGKLVFQAAIKFHITEGTTGKRLFNFITATDFEMKKLPIEDGFYELTHSFILAAIDDFNDYIKPHKSTLIRNFIYPKDIPFEKNKEAVRKAWLVYDTGGSPKSN